MNYLNAKYNENGTIDCEIDHPDAGWIPITLADYDPDTAEMFATVSSGTVAPFVAYVPTQEEIKTIKLKAFETAVQLLLDSTAKSKGYDSIISACSYAAAVNQFQTESIAFIEWRGNVWTYCYEQMSVFTGDIEDFILTLPEFGV